MIKIHTNYLFLILPALLLASCLQAADEELCSPAPTSVAEPGIHSEIPEQVSSSDSDVSSSSASSDENSDDPISSITSAIESSTNIKPDILALTQIMRNARSNREALTSFNKIISDPSITGEVRAIAFSYIGALYQAGKSEVPRDFIKATKNYENSLTFVDLPEPVRVAVCIHLGFIYFQGGLGISNTKALRNLRFVLKMPRPYLPSTLIAKAFACVGDIYTLSGCTGILIKAIRNYTKALNMPELPASVNAHVHTQLGNIYSRGDFARQNLAKAEEHYTIALESGNLDKDRTSYVVNKLSSLSQLNSNLPTSSSLFVPLPHSYSNLVTSSSASSSSSSSGSSATPLIESTSQRSQPAIIPFSERHHIDNIRELFRTGKYEKAHYLCKYISQNPNISSGAQKYASEFMKALQLERPFPLPNVFEIESAFYNHKAFSAELPVKERAQAIFFLSVLNIDPLNPEQNREEAYRLLEEAFAIPNGMNEKMRESWKEILETIRHRTQTSSSSTASSHAHPSSSNASSDASLSAVALAKEDSSSSVSHSLPALPPAFRESARRLEREQAIDSLTDEYLENVSDKRQKTAQRYSCNLCGKTYATRQAYKVHENTKKHKKNEKKQHQDASNSDGSTTLDDDDFIPSLPVLREPTSNSGAGSSQPALPLREPAKRVEREQAIDSLTDEHLENDKRQKIAQRYPCDLCGETYATLQGYKVHESTKKHKKNEKERHLILPVIDDTFTSWDNIDFIPSERVATTTLEPIARIGKE